MSSENVEIKDGLKIRKLTKLKTGAEQDYEEAMLKRVEYFKKQNAKKSGFNNIVENTLFSTFSSILDLKLNIDKAIGEENLKKIHKVLDEVLLFGL